MNRIVRLTCALLLVACGTNGHGHDWPVQPVNVDHPLGATLGEFQDVSNAPDKVYQHTGLDILMRPCDSACKAGDTKCRKRCNAPCGDPKDVTARPCAFVTVGGDVSQLTNAPYTLYNFTRIDTAGSNPDKPRMYQYYHLEYNTFDANFMNQYNSSGVVGNGAPIARVTPWKCDYHHLHYDVYESDGRGGYTYLNPLRDVEPKPDPDPPAILAISLAGHEPPASRWSTQFDSTDLPACAVVKGNVDIIAQVLDQDPAGSGLPGATSVGTYNLRWRACPTTTPECAWNVTHEYSAMPAAWGDQAPNSATQNHFSTTSPWVSDFNECPPVVDGKVVVNKTFAVPTSPSGWDTTTGYPDGSYSVSVEASDLANNVTKRTAHVCVQNMPGCTTDLAIRDGADDTGAIPYTGSSFGGSPYVTVNPGTPEENRTIRLGAANRIDVEVWNTGSCTLQQGATYDVCFGWNGSTGSVLFPSPNQRVQCKTETISGVWAPRASRVTTFAWTPGGNVPSGDGVVVAWSNMQTDPVKPTRSVALDNNQAQRDIVFMARP
jgi:hypothetical protein